MTGRNAELKRATQVLNQLQRATGCEKRLNPEQHLWYRAWRAQRCQPMEASVAEAYYAASLQRGAADPNPIRPDIYRILVPIIYEHDTEATASGNYARYAQSN